MVSAPESELRLRRIFSLASFVFLVVVGLADYFTGFDLSFSVFYLLAIGLAVWFVGPGFGVFMSVASICSWLLGDYEAGATYANPFILVWNAAILFTFYLVVVWLLTWLRSLNRNLENRVKQRSAALIREIAERERLEQELLGISEREQRRIGHDLHDNFCQQLTSTAMAVEVLRERLAARDLPEAADAAKISTLVENGIAQARELARGLSPVELEAEGLMSALQELAASVSQWSAVGCAFQCEAPVPVDNVAVATNLYRIAQEAVSNAIRHGKARHIIIGFEEDSTGIILSIEDDGVGLPENWDHSGGLGTRIMAHRATIVGGALSIEPNPTGGTLVRCHVPVART